MSSPNPVIVPQTAAVTVQLQTQEGDRVALYRTGTWGAGEDATVNFPTTTGSIAAYYDPGLGPVSVGVTNVSVLIEGGFLFTIVKPVTVAAAGIDYQIKPRQGC